MRKQERDGRWLSQAAGVELHRPVEAAERREVGLSHRLEDAENGERRWRERLSSKGLRPVDMQRGEGTVAALHGGLLSDSCLPLEFELTHQPGANAQ